MNDKLSDLKSKFLIAEKEMSKQLKIDCISEILSEMNDDKVNDIYHILLEIKYNSK